MANLLDRLWAWSAERGHEPFFVPDAAAHFEVPNQKITVIVSRWLKQGLAERTATATYRLKGKRTAPPRPTGEVRPGILVARAIERLGTFTVPEIARLTDLSDGAVRSALKNLLPSLQRVGRDGQHLRYRLADSEEFVRTRLSKETAHGTR